MVGLGNQGRCRRKYERVRGNFARGWGYEQHLFLAMRFFGQRLRQKKEKRISCRFPYVEEVRVSCGHRRSECRDYRVRRGPLRHESLDWGKSAQHRLRALRSVFVPVVDNVFYIFARR